MSPHHDRDLPSIIASVRGAADWGDASWTHFVRPIGDQFSSSVDDECVGNDLVRCEVCRVAASTAAAAADEIPNVVAALKCGDWASATAGLETMRRLEWEAGGASPSMDSVIESVESYLAHLALSSGGAL